MPRPGEKLQAKSISACMRDSGREVCVRHHFCFLVDCFVCCWLRGARYLHEYYETNETVYGIYSVFFKPWCKLLLDFYKKNDVGRYAATCWWIE